MKQVLMGNHAVSHGVRLSRAQVIAAYPITPQTHIVEELSEMCADGRLKAKFIKVESEHSAMACCVGASAAGARAFTATSSHGLALMHEVLHWAAGARLPIVMANVNRALGAPWNIFSDQTDTLAQRDTGWLQFYCESNQEALDAVIQAFRISEEVRLPSMVVLDAFFLSHTYEIVDVPDQEMVDEYLPPYRPKFKLDVNDPHTFNSMAMPEYFMELRHKLQKAADRAIDVARRAGEEFGRIFGRNYGLWEAYRCEDAEMIMLASGTICSTTRVVVDELRDRGVPAGMLKVRMFRPFPVEDYRKLLGGAKKVGVIDRNVSFGMSGGFAETVRAALYNGDGGKPPIFGFIAGLGGRDVTPENIRWMFNYMMENDRPESEQIWVGVKK